MIDWTYSHKKQKFDKCLKPFTLLRNAQVSVCHGWIRDLACVHVDCRSSNLVRCLPWRSHPSSMSDAIAEPTQKMHQQCANHPNQNASIGQQCANHSAQSDATVPVATYRRTRGWVHFGCDAFCATHKITSPPSSSSDAIHQPLRSQNITDSQHHNDIWWQ